MLVPHYSEHDSGGMTFHLYFALGTPAGKKKMKKWLETVPGKGWFFLLCLFVAAGAIV